MKKQTVAVLIFDIVLVLLISAAPSSSSKTQQKCNGPNEEFKCILPCDTTCLDLQFARRCGGPCVEDCYCKDGYLRDEDDDGKCKLPKDCFSNQKTGQIG